MNFTDLGISAALVQALEKEGIKEPMPIQTEAMPALIAGKDAYVSAETGTGKTLAYLLPIFGKIDPAVPNAQAIILAPTHELASQIHQQALLLAQNSGLPIKSLLLIGGANTQRQLDKLKKKPQLIVGSAGRILELIGMKKLKVPKVGTVVIDEADRVLFGESLAVIRDILRTLPDRPQLVFVSATEQSASSAEAQKLAPELVRLSAGANQVNADIQHLYFVGEERSKADLLRRLIRAIEPERAIVFVHRNKDAELVKAKMGNYSIPVVDIHATHGKLERTKAMNDFRSGRVNILIASDVAARGLDIKGVTHIFNYDAPSSSKDYLHRTGRTGRAGEQGYAISLLTEQEIRLARRYETELGIQLVAATIREGQIFAAEE
ncbi:MAG: DEAD/DEAH box helicase [Kiritimatiellales bacterium]|nr:DEAD/DEAH box helicase [Kiritimatiellales bacterium]